MYTLFTLGFSYEPPVIIILGISVSDILCNVIILSPLDVFRTVPPPFISKFQFTHSLQSAPRTADSPNRGDCLNRRQSPPTSRRLVSSLVVPATPHAPLGLQRSLRLLKLAKSRQVSKRNSRPSNPVSILTEIPLIAAKIATIRVMVRITGFAP